MGEVYVASAARQNSMDFLISVIRSEPGGTGYSNSIVAWMFHLLSRMSLKRLRDRRVTLAERNVCALVRLPILHVNVRDSIVVRLEERNRRSVVARHEVADVQVRAVVRRVAEHLLPVLGPVASCPW